MDGFKNVSIYRLGLESVFIPAGVLLVNAVVFFSLAAKLILSCQES